MFADTDLRQGSDIESDEDEDMEDDDTGPPQDGQGNPGIPSVRCCKRWVIEVAQMLKLHDCT